MERLARAALLLLCVIVAASCQRTTAGDEAEEETQTNKVTATFKISNIEQVEFASAKHATRATDLKQACSHVLFIVYNTSGERVMYKAQNSTDKDFGQISTQLNVGTYRFVILAYNSKDNPSSFTSPDKITFGNNGKMSDTFLWSEEIAIDNGLEKDVTLKRAIAAFRLVTTDNIPSNVVKMRFQYTGGSSTINAITGAGCVNSRQDESIAVTSTGKPGTFEVYTFPRDDENVLKMEITALDANNNVVASHTFDEVPIKRNKVTQYSGEFFNSGSSESGSVSFNITIEDDWEDPIYKNF